MLEIKTKVLTTGQMPDGIVYDKTRLREIAEAYNELNYSAPWCIGHQPKDGDPAIGWVRELEVKGDSLYAISEFNELGQTLIESKEYENKSVSLYTPDSPYNPIPGVFSLRHIALLGAQVPASKDLGPVIEYAEDDTEYVSYECGCGTKYTPLARATLPTNEVEIMNEIKTQLQEALALVEQLRSEKELLTQQYEAELQTKRHQLVAMDVAGLINPYYSEGYIDPEQIPEEALIHTLTKMRLGVTDYSEKELTPIALVEMLLNVIINGREPEEVSYGEEVETENLPEDPFSGEDNEKTSSLHARTVKAKQDYNLSYSQALRAVVAADALGSTNYTENLKKTVTQYLK